MKNESTIAIRVGSASEGPKVDAPAISLKAAPDFAIHRAYYGDGHWSDTGWKISHRWSGHSCGDAVYGRNGLKAMRVCAAVLQRMPVDWTRANIGYEDFAAIPKEIREWCKLVNRSYR